MVRPRSSGQPLRSRRLGRAARARADAARGRPDAVPVLSAPFRRPGDRGSESRRARAIPPDLVSPVHDPDDRHRHLARPSGIRFGPHGSEARTRGIAGPRHLRPRRPGFPPRRDDRRLPPRGADRTWIRRPAESDHHLASDVRSVHGERTTSRASGGGHHAYHPWLHYRLRLASRLARLATGPQVRALEGHRHRLPRLPRGGGVPPPPWVARLPSRRRRRRWVAARRPGRAPRTLLRDRSLARIPDDHPRAGGSDLTGRRPRAVSHAGHDEGLPGLGSTPPPLPRQGGTLSRQEPRPRTEARFEHRDDRHVRDGVPRRDARPDGLVGSVPRRTSPLGHAFRYCHVDVIF